MDGRKCKSASCGWWVRASSQVMDGLSLSSLLLTIHYLKFCLKFRKSEMRAALIPNTGLFLEWLGQKSQATRSERFLSRSKSRFRCQPVPNSKGGFCPHPDSEWVQAPSQIEIAHTSSFDQSRFTALPFDRQTISRYSDHCANCANTPP